MRATVESHHSVTVYVPNVPTLLETSIERWNSEQICLHVLFTSDAPGIACLHWHPSMTGPLTLLFNKWLWWKSFVYSSTVKLETGAGTGSKPAPDTHWSKSGKCALTHHKNCSGGTRGRWQRAEGIQGGPIVDQTLLCPNKTWTKDLPGGLVVFSIKGCWRRVLWVGRWMPPCIRLGPACHPELFVRFLQRFWSSFLMCQSTLCCWWPTAIGESCCHGHGILGLRHVWVDGVC